jgi:hypothetical protein
VRILKALNEKKARKVSTYTWVSDQYSAYGTKIIVVTHREAQPACRG